jgi:formate hydrogenlyase subunit 4
MSLVVGLVAQLVHIALVLAAAPTLIGVCRWLEARLSGRSGPSVLQHWHDLLRLLRKESVVAESASGLSTIAPVISAAAIVIAAALVPSFTLGMIFAPFSDLLVIAGMLAIARCSLALAAMDAGTAFGGMGASRTMLLACWSEPALLLVVFVLALLAGSSNLDVVAAVQQESGADWRASVILALAAMLLVAFADAGWGPRSHSVLAMRGQAMMLEFSGRNLALIEGADALRLLLWLNLIGAMFLPFGMAPADAGPVTWLLGLACWFARLLVFAVVLAVLPTVLGRTRLLRASHMLGVAMLLGLLAAVYLFADMGSA